MNHLLSFKKFVVNEKFGRIEDYDDLYYNIDINDIQSVRSAVNHGINLEHRDKDGNTPLIYAASKKKTAIVKLFLDSGADRNARNKCGDSFKDYLVGTENKKCQKVLDHA